MPFYDRYWRLRLVGAALAGVFGLLVFVRLVVPTLVLGRVSADTWVAIALGAVSLAVSGLWARSTTPARERKERRERAMAGDQDAMPLAD